MSESKTLKEIKVLNNSDAKVSLDGGKTFHDANFTEIRANFTEIRHSEKDPVYKPDLKITKGTTFSGTFTVKIPEKIRTIFRKWIDMIMKETDYERLN